VDKALYEVLYEREYRPDRVEIPRRAIRRLIDG
jgi:predicted trehalose synthase